MRLIVDRDRCRGHAQCVLAAPDLLALDEKRKSSLIDGAQVRDHVDEARDAELLCPEFAITLVD
jgi:ferredoxin